jgi:magnesium and cobalt transporter
VREQGGLYRVKAQTEIADFNRVFGTKYSDADFDTVGGLVLHRFGRLPGRGEAITIDGLRVQVLRADSRKLHVLQVHRLPAKP